MAQLKNLATDTLYTVTNVPMWINGMWECGDQRFTDLNQTLYAPVATYPLISAVSFYLAFSVAEAIAIKNSIDLIVKEFYDRLQMMISEGLQVDPNSVSIQEGLAYLSTTNQNPSTVAAWAANTAYAVNASVSVGTSAYVCTTAGASGNVAPSGIGAAISDGTVVWQYTPTSYIASIRVTQILTGVQQ